MVGWLTYLSVPLDALPPLPPFADAAPLGRGGSLIRLLIDRFDPDDPDHDAQRKVLFETLDASGLLRRGPWPSAPADDGDGRQG